LTLLSEAAVPSSCSYKSVTKEALLLFNSFSFTTTSPSGSISITLCHYQICPFCNAVEAVLA
jgi:hypothetical protein